MFSQVSVQERKRIPFNIWYSPSFKKHRKGRQKRQTNREKQTDWKEEKESRQERAKRKKNNALHRFLA